MFIHNEQKTYTWKKMGLIVELVITCLKNVSSVHISDVQIITNFLSNTLDPRLQYLKKNRGIYTFLNGAYFFSQDLFLEWTDPQLAMIIEKRPFIACKYFPHTFENIKYESEMKDPKKSWRNIDTGLFDKLIDSQNYPVSVKDWIYVLIGRLLFKNREMDNWEITLRIKDEKSQSWKENIIFYTVSNLYSLEDITVMDEYTETHQPYLLYNLHSSFLYIGTHNKKFMDLATWIQINSGDTVVIKRPNPKHKEDPTEPTNIVFHIESEIPGIISSEFTSQWPNIAHSVKRRCPTIMFTKQHSDEKKLAEFYDDINSHMGAIIKKISIAYKEFATTYGVSSIWELLLKDSDYFLKHF